MLCSEKPSSFFQRNSVLLMCDSPTHRGEGVHRVRGSVRAKQILILPLRIALAQIIFRGAWGGAGGGAEGGELFRRHRDDAAVRAHLDHVEALGRILEHPMLAVELG